MRGSRGERAARERGIARWASLPLFLAALLVASAATASVWTFDAPSEDLPLSEEEIAKRRAADDYSDGETEATADEKALLAERARAEEDFVEAHSPPALHSAADGAIALPAILESIGLDTLTKDAFPRMRLAASKEESKFEEAYLTDGSAELLVSWQVWPNDLNASMAIPPRSEVTDLSSGGKLATTQADLLKIQTAEARRYDGTYLVSVVLIDDEPGELALVEGLGTAVLQRLYESR